MKLKVSDLRTENADLKKSDTKNKERHDLDIAILEKKVVTIQNKSAESKIALEKKLTWYSENQETIEELYDRIEKQSDRIEEQCIKIVDLEAEKKWSGASCITSRWRLRKATPSIQS
eukprot:UN23261